MVQGWIRASIVAVFLVISFDGYLARVTAAEADPVQVSLVRESAQLRSGRPFRVALRMAVQKGWHIYGDGPTDASGATSVDWVVPVGFKVNEVRWSCPKRLSDTENIYGYEGTGTVVAEIVPVSNISQGQGDIKVQVSWVACGDSCVPGQSTASLPLATTSQPTTHGVWGLLVSEAQGSPLCRANDSDATDTPGTLLGDFGIAVSLAFLGGLVLNLMPCVLPVISFKVMGFVQMAKESRAAILRHSLAFFVGVLLSFWGLAGVLLALRAYGQSVGWGFQLQEPLFVGLLAIALLIFGLSLFGVFELGTGMSAWAGKEEAITQKKFSGLTGSFLSGVLATAVATPCTGPFLGTTLGFAVTLPSSLAMIVFTAMATGMSMPYLLVAFVPGALRYFPKPGAWMVTFREIMGFVIMLTVLWLVWVFLALTAPLSVFLLLSAFVSAAIACWVFGKWGHAARASVPRMIGIVLAAVFMTSGLCEVVAASRISSDPKEHQQDASAWETFSAEKLEKYRREGVPVFVDFTAKWCLICQANKVALHADSVVKKFSEKGVVRMTADWTKNDPFITQELKKLGRSGVPLYVLYVPGETEPQVLPQVLTPDVVTNSLDAIGR